MKKNSIGTLAAFVIMLCVASFGSGKSCSAQKSNGVFEIVAFSKDSVQLEIAADTKLYSVALISGEQSFDGESFSNLVDTVYWANGAQFWPGSSMGMPASFGVGAMTLHKGAVLKIYEFGTPEGFKPTKIKITTDGATEMYYNISKSSWEK